MTAQQKQLRGTRPKPANNVYTAILALALLAVLAATILVAFKCYSQYGTLFTIPG